MATSSTRLVLAIVQSEDSRPLVERLVEGKFGATRIDTAGGFLRRENALVMVATDERELPRLFAILRQSCQRRVVPWFPPAMDGMFPQIGQPIDVEVGGAVVFVLPVERVEYLGVPTRRREVKREAAAVSA